MKKITLLIFAMVALFACSTDENAAVLPDIKQQTVIGQNPIKQLFHSFDTWELGEVQEVFSSFIQEGESFTFSKTFFSDNIEDGDIDAYRFILGVKNNKMQIVCVGINDGGRIITTIFEIGVLNAEAINLEDINEQQNVNFDVTDIEDLDVKKHILQTKDAIEYLSDWNLIFNDIDNLDDVISYDGERIKHFTITKAAMHFLVDRSNVTEIELVFGLNAEHKMTPMFFGKNGKNVIFDTAVVNFLLGFSNPCINDCNPRGMN